MQLAYLKGVRVEPGIYSIFFISNFVPFPPGLGISTLAAHENQLGALRNFNA